VNNINSRTVNSFQDRGVDEEVFQLPAKLHLTLGTLRLFSEEEQVRPAYSVSLYIDLFIYLGKSGVCTTGMFRNCKVRLSLMQVYSILYPLACNVHVSDENFHLPLLYHLQTSTGG